MAKQTGLHQLRGKVGEHSYYRQSGVSAGLVRSINPSMSGRVKTSAEFANTRLNMAEFKNATRAAATFLNAVTPKYRPMFNTFRQARTAKELLALIKGNAGKWGQRQLLAGNSSSIAKVINAASKNRMDELFAEIRIGTDEGSVNELLFTVADSFNDVLRSYGADGVYVHVYAVGAYLGQAAEIANLDEQLDNLTRIKEGGDNEFQVGTAAGSTVNVDAESILPDLTIATGRNFIPMFYAVVLPYRTVGGTNYTLQEACRFAVLEDSTFGS